MKMNVLKVVQMVNLNVPTDHVFMLHGHATATQTVQMVLMKLTVAMHVWVMNLG
jgi:hypothetical protein